MVSLLSTVQASAWAAPTRPTLRMSFAADVWTLQNSSDSLFVNQTVHVAVSDALGAIAQNDSLKDGRLAASVGFHSPQATSAAAGVYALDPFFDRIACYLYPPTLVGDPSHITITWPMALQLLYGGVDLAIYNRSSYHGTASFDGHDCELWIAGFNTSDEASFCVQRSTGLLLSANHTAYQGNIHEISKSVLSDVEHIDPTADAFDVPDKKGCVDLRPLLHLHGAVEEEEEMPSAAPEDEATMLRGVNLSLSVEFLMDCNAVNNGCAGGLLDDSWRFMATTGLPTESCVPYQEEAGPLPTGPIPCSAVQRCLPGGAGPKDFLLHAAKGGAYPVGDFTGDAEGMQRDLMANGPISVAFQVFSDFHSYSSGVYKRTAAGQLDGGHAVKIVGWGTDAKGGPYWIVANSWGATWGMDGFFKIARGVNECGIEQTPAAGMIGAVS